MTDIVLEPVGGSHVTRSAERADIRGGAPVDRLRPTSPARKTSRRVEYQPSVRKKLYWCWSNGLEIGRSVLAIKRHLGVELSPEEVRVAFVGLAEKFS